MCTLIGSQGVLLTFQQGISGMVIVGVDQGGPQKGLTRLSYQDRRNLQHPSTNPDLETEVEVEWDADPGSTTDSDIDSASDSDNQREDVPRSVRTRTRTIRPEGSSYLTSG